jgi:hypothetical protein
MKGLDKILSHYGIKGMKWGVVRPIGPTGVVVTSTPGKKVKTSGGTGQPASDDAVKTAALRQRAKKSTTDSLSNKELQDLVTRMNLERQYSTLAPKTPKQQVAKFLTDTLLGIGKQEVSKLAASAASQQIGKALKK